MCHEDKGSKWNKIGKGPSSSAVGMARKMESPTWMRASSVESWGDANDWIVGIVAVNVNSC